MSEDRITNVEKRVDRLEKAFRLTPFALLAALAVAAIVIVVFR
jgi:hypothetical protein